MNLLIVDDERYIVNYLFALIEEHIEIDLNIQKPILDQKRWKSFRFLKLI